MALGNLVIGTTTFVDTGRGRYIDNTQTLGGLRNEIKIAPGTLAKRAVPQTVNASISRLQEKTVTINSVATTKRASVTVSFAIEPGYLPADADILLTDLATYITGATLNTILNGAS